MQHYLLRALNSNQRPPDFFTCPPCRSTESPTVHKLEFTGMGRTAANWTKSKNLMASLARDFCGSDTMKAKRLYK